MPAARGGQEASPPETCKSPLPVPDAVETPHPHSVTRSKPNETRQMLWGQVELSRKPLTQLLPSVLLLPLSPAQAPLAAISWGGGAGAAGRQGLRCLWVGVEWEERCLAPRGAAEIYGTGFLQAGERPQAGAVEPSRGANA